MAALIQKTLLVLLVLSLLNEFGRKKSGKPLEQVDIFDTFHNTDINVKLFKYPIFRQKKIAKPFVKNVFIVISSGEFIIFDKIIIPKDVSSSIQSFNSRFLDKIKILNTDKAYNKNCLKASNYTVKVIFIYYLYYKKIPEMTESIYKLFFFWLLSN